MSEEALVDSLVITEQEQARINEATQQATEQVSEVVRAASAVTVSSVREAQAAGAFLVQVVRRKKENEELRKELVQPLNEYVANINRRMKDGSAPLAEAEKLVRDKITVYQDEQEKLRREQEERQREIERELQRRAEEEKRAAEDRAREEREAAARELARVEAAEAASRAQREGELAVEMGGLNLKDLYAVALDPSDVVRQAAAKAEIGMRRAAEESSARVRRARADAEAALATEEEVRAEPVMEVARMELAAAPVLRVQGGKVGSRKRWVGRPVDVSRVPREYLMVDQKKINAAVKAGVREIPGVEIKEESGLSVRT